jgi:hypothetical protein
MSCPEGQNCGTASDGCGDLMSCGTCESPETCGGGGEAGHCGACVPTDCGALGAVCGSHPDNCGGTIDCDNSYNFCIGMGSSTADEATCNSDLENLISMCAEQACTLSGPMTCTVGGSPSSPECWGADVMCSSQ